MTYQFPDDGDPGYVGMRIGQSHFGITAIVEDPDGNQVIIGTR